MLFFCCLTLSFSHAQSEFSFLNGVKKYTTSFKLINNLIVFPIEVNGKELNFILDSGVGATLLFNIKESDSVKLRNLERKNIRGLGGMEEIEAIISRGNLFRMKNIQGEHQNLYMVTHDSFDLSTRLGITIHGIIGYELLKDFVVKISYGSKRITFYDPEYFEYKDCKKCDDFNLEFYRLKPYIEIGAKLDSEEVVPVKLLIDTGGSDAMWLFENSKPEIKEPAKYFRDFLGEGLGGEVYGKRARINALVLGKFELENPTVSYPDSLSIAYARKFTERNGSVGGSVLNRFEITFNYKKGKFYIKKGSGFSKPFNYNMSGIELAYNGKILVGERDNSLNKFAISTMDDVNNNPTVFLEYQYKYKFKPSYRVHHILPNSPASEAGIMEGDILIKINNKFTHDMTLDEIVAIFYEKEGKRVNVLVERYGQNYEYKFRLRDLLQ